MPTGVLDGLLEGEGVLWTVEYACSDHGKV